MSQRIACNTTERHSQVRLRSIDARRGSLILAIYAAANEPGAGSLNLVSFARFRTLSVVPTIPVAGMALILGIDRFMSEARAGQRDRQWRGDDRDLADRGQTRSGPTERNPRRPSGRRRRGGSSDGSGRRHPAALSQSGLVPSACQGGIPRPGSGTRIEIGARKRRRRAAVDGAAATGIWQCPLAAMNSGRAIA